MTNNTTHTPLYPCPNGHSSTDPDYCSECGKKIDVSGRGLPSALVTGGGGLSATLAAGANGGEERCPDCGTPRMSPTALFCEVCRYDFAHHRPWSPLAEAHESTSVGASVAIPQATPVPEPPAPMAVPVPVAPAPEPASGSLRRWEAVVTVDASLNVDPDPTHPVPVGEPERRFPLDFAENLIGRRSEKRGIFPEISLSDPGASTRHAYLYKDADGSLSVLDVGSTNGTQVNGRDLVAGVRTPLSDGDQVTIGCWTRMTIHAL